MAGGPESFAAFRDLVQLLLGCTVLAQGEFVRLTQRDKGVQDVRVVGGASGPTSPVRLRDGRWLRVAITLFLDRGSNRLKVEKSSYQYQVDQDGQREVFRYDYLRQRGEEYPSCHLNVHGELQEDVLPSGTTLARVHFPTDRVSLEAVIRLLVRDFKCETAYPATIWGPALETSEVEFQKIAHRPSSGG
jgi:hypothetical protein